MQEELKCPRCTSSQTSFRVKTKDRICYKCGNVYEVDFGNLNKLEKTNG